MQFFENEIKQYTEFAMSTLDLEVTPRPAESNEILKHPVTAHIDISGNWQGLVSVVMEQDLARRLAEKMFSCNEGEGSNEEIDDAISEMTNMIGGNLKSLLPQPNQLSLPIVDKEEVRLGFPHMVQISEVAFDCAGSIFKVAIHRVRKTESQNQPANA